MFVDIHVEPYEIKKQVEYTIEFPEYGKFPIMQINRGSYIAGAKIETSLNFHVSDGCYNLQIGKYCAMAEDILFMMDLMHDYKYVSMGAIEELKGIHNPNEKYERYRVQRKGQILIENDVWIGHGATIMGGVIIHNGAVVGANAVVTKDVPPYAIVAGNPARVIKYRFDDEIIKKLLNIRWWDWTPELIKDRSKEMLYSADKFANEFYEHKKVSREMKNPINKNVSGPVYTCIADMDKTFPVFPRDFSAMLKYKLLVEESRGYSRFVDINEDLSDRILKNLYKSYDYESLCDILKSKNVTYARVSRMLCHILLNLKKSDMYAYRNNGTVFYARVLGFREDIGGLGVMKALHQYTSIPIITKVSDGKELATDLAQRQFHHDILAAHIYESIIADKYQTEMQNEYTRSIIKL